MAEGKKYQRQLYLIKKLWKICARKSKRKGVILIHSLIILSFLFPMTAVSYEQIENLDDQRLVEKDETAGNGPLLHERAFARTRFL